MKAPNFRKMLKEGEAWKVSARIEKKGNRKIWMKKSVRSQHSIPNDKNLLAKVGLNKKETALGFYFPLNMKYGHISLFFRADPNRPNLPGERLQRKRYNANPTLA